MPSYVNVYCPFPNDCIPKYASRLRLVLGSITTEGLDAQFETVAVTTVPFASTYELWPNDPVTGCVDGVGVGVGDGINDGFDEGEPDGVSVGCALGVVDILPVVLLAALEPPANLIVTLP